MVRWLRVIWSILFGGVPPPAAYAPVTHTRQYPKQYVTAYANRAFSENILCGSASKRSSSDVAEWETRFRCTCGQEMMSGDGPKAIPRRQKPTHCGFRNRPAERRSRVVCGATIVSYRRRMQIGPLREGRGFRMMGQAPGSQKVAGTYPLFTRPSNFTRFPRRFPLTKLSKAD